MDRQTSTGLRDAALFLITLGFGAVLLGMSAFSGRFGIAVWDGVGGYGSAGAGLVPNGGFENVFFAWTTVDSVAIASDPVHGGSNAFRAMDNDSSAYAFVYQELGFTYDTTQITFWAYPGSNSYYQVFEVIANWQNGTATFITRVGLTTDDIRFTAVDTSSSIPNVLIPDAWNKLTVKANASTLTQDFYVNDSLYASLTSTEFPAVEHVLVGDLSITANYGTIYYDDISITGSVVTPLPLAVDDQFVDDGSGPKFFPVLHNDIIPPGVDVEIVIDDPPEHGEILSIEADGFWFQKEAGFEGEDQLSYSLAVLTQGTTHKTLLVDGASMIYLAYVCACYLFTSKDSFNDCVGVTQPPDRLGNRFGRDHAALVDSVDLDLLVRWRDEILRATEAGSVLFDNMAFNLPEIHQVVLVDRPELIDRVLRVFLLLEDPARSLLDGDGSEVITQAQMDSLNAFFASLEAGVSDEVAADLRRDLAALGSLDDYVGHTAVEALEMLQNATGTAVEDDLPSSNEGFVLEQNFPNPFRERTTIRFMLDEPTPVSLTIYDIRGRNVRTLLDRQRRRGVQSVIWDGSDDRGFELPSGVYFVRLQVGDSQRSRRVVQVR